MYVCVFVFFGGGSWRAAWVAFVSWGPVERHGAFHHLPAGVLGVCVGREATIDACVRGADGCLLSTGFGIERLLVVDRCLRACGEG